jgi:hypothetical protein
MLSAQTAPWVETLPRSERRVVELAPRWLRAAVREMVEAKQRRPAPLVSEPHLAKLGKDERRTGISTQVPALFQVHEPLRQALENQRST